VIADLDTLLTALYVELDDRIIPARGFARSGPGRPPDVTDAELTCIAVLLLDDFAMRELTAAQADDLYELITERAGKSLILTSNRAPADWYPLFPNPVVAAVISTRSGGKAG
jgi:DNA replication protein DnaC